MTPFSLFLSVTGYALRVSNEEVQTASNGQAIYRSAVRSEPVRVPHAERRSARTTKKELGGGRKKLDVGAIEPYTRTSIVKNIKKNKIDMILFEVDSHNEK